MKHTKLSAWKRALILAFVALATLFMTNIGTVNAMLTGMHTLYVTWRFEKEVLRATPIGQYYDGLILKHSGEAMQVINAHPEGLDGLERLADLTLPLLEAYLNGKGDETIITVEQMEALQSELDWFHSNGSPDLQAVIEQESNRFPLEQFVGMTVSQAYVHVLVNFDGVLHEPDLVAQANGEWAYTNLNGIYFEYPSAWYVQKNTPSEVVIIPSAQNPGAWETGFIIVDVDQGVTPDHAAEMSIRLDIRESKVLWEEPVLQSGGFAGYEFALLEPYQIAVAMVAELYNEQTQTFVSVLVLFLDPFGIQFDSGPEAIRNHQEYFFHLVDSVIYQQP